MFPKDKFVAPFVGSVAKLSVPIPYKYKVNVPLSGSSDSIVSSAILDPVAVIEKSIVPLTAAPPAIGPAEILVENSDIAAPVKATRSEEHTSELQSRPHLVCR